MSKLVVWEILTLDGVMQAPARPDEDRRGGFDYGGWAVPYNDPVMASAAAAGMSRDGALLFGRRPYEDFYAVWPNRTDNPFTAVLNSTQKYVASNTLAEPLAWKNSTLLKGDAAKTVAALKANLGKDTDLMVLGSGVLVQSLIKHGLVDEYVLMIHPLLLGTGRRLFPADGSVRRLRLVDTKPTTTGVVIVTYQPANG